MNDQNISIVLLCGMPASGKSTFGQNLCNFIYELNSTHGPVYEPFLFSYDSIIDSSLESAIIETLEWKTARLLIKKLIKKFVDYLCVDSAQQAQSVNDFYNTFHLENNLYKALLSNFLRTAQLNIDNNSHLTHKSNVNHKIVILDDNFYFESMRHEFFKLISCLELTKRTAYFCVFFECNKIELLLKRNSKRDLNSRISDEIIQKMFEKFEYQNNRLDYEREFSLTLHINEKFKFEKDFFIKFLDQLEQNHTCFFNFKSDIVAKDLKKIEMLKLSQESTKNLLHQCDLILRRLTTEKISKSSKDHLKQILDCKKTILNEIKVSESEIFKRFASNINDLNLIEEIITHKFKSLLNF